MTSKENKEQIKAFIENKAMVAAVMSVLLPSDEEFADALSTDLDDAEYGRAVRAWVGARELIKSRFAELTRIASTSPQSAPQNEAR